MSRGLIGFAVPAVFAAALGASEARADNLVDAGIAPVSGALHPVSAAFVSPAGGAAMMGLPHVSAQQSTRVQSSGMIAGGVVLSVLGLAGTVLGVVALVVECTGAECGANEVLGGVSLGLSLATEVTGIVLIAVGSTPRRVVTQNELHAPTVARPAPDVFRLSLRGLGLRMNF